jgi:glycosyltransferase involved in cell wall biosynthesis
MQNNNNQNTKVISAPKKRFLLIYVAMYTGGIETLILRMTDWLIENNNEVDILLVKNQGELLKNININANVISLGGFPELRFFSHIYKKVRVEYDVVYSFSPVTIWMALLISQKQIKKPVVLNGVYHLYDLQIFGDPYTKKLFDSILPDWCKVFMTPYVRLEHEKIFNRQFLNPIIWPLPININKLASAVRVPKLFKIVSIGRLAAFKTYNLYMLDIIKQLLSLNYNVEYYIYGDGELFDSIEKKVADLKLKDHVYLCGTVSYDRLPEILSDAYVFIGMGTSVIEAGMCKVPAIVAIAYTENSITHGLVHELPDFSCGEFIENYPVYNVLDQLRTLFDYDTDEYNKICNDTFVKLSSDYEINRLMNSLLTRINNFSNEERQITKIKIPIIYILNKTISRIVNQIKTFIKDFILYPMK